MLSIPNKTPDLNQSVHSVSTGEMNITEIQLFQPAFSKKALGIIHSVHLQIFSKKLTSLTP